MYRYVCVYLSYRVVLRAQVNFSVPTFDPVHEARAGQLVALSIQSAAAAMQHLEQRSASELSPYRGLR